MRPSTGSGRTGWIRCWFEQKRYGRTAETHVVCFIKRQRKENGCFFILLFLDEKKQKSSDYRIVLKILCLS
jgi:hypothetical protein